MFEFNIGNIERNWIWIKFKDELNEVILDNSLLGGCDAPNVLLKTLCELFMEKECEKYIAFHGESNIYVIQTLLLNEFVTLSIYNCKHSSFGLPYDGDILSSYLKYSCEQWTLQPIPLYTFGNTVYEEFKQYVYGEKLEWYEKSKYEFPSKQFKCLKNCLYP